MVPSRITALMDPLIIFTLWSLIAGAIATTVDHKVFCTAKEMTVTITLPDSKAQVYIDKLKGYPDCRPVIEGSRATFHLSLEDIFTCGTTRISDDKGRKLYYNRIVVEVSKTKKEKIRAKCESRGRSLSELSSNRQERDLLPEGFVEPDDINITETVIGNGVFPELNVGVRQNGNFIDTELNVQPGTPLEMEVSLDRNTSSTYGVLVSSMNVTDKTPGLREIIIFKGCSIDPFLFSNFELQENGVSAKFRAFKFPESSYVLFIGTVIICIGPCEGIPCSNGQLGYGRRRREISVGNDDFRPSNQIFEITMTTILKVNEDEKDFINQGSLGNTAADTGNTRIIVTEQEIVDPNFLERNEILENSCQTATLSAMLSALIILFHFLKNCSVV